MAALPASASRVGGERGELSPPPGCSGSRIRAAQTHLRAPGEAGGGGDGGRCGSVVDPPLEDGPPIEDICIALA